MNSLDDILSPLHVGSFSLLGYIDYLYANNDDAPPCDFLFSAFCDVTWEREKWVEFFGAER